MSFALLSNSPNPKIAKGKALGVWTFVLHLAPAKLSGFEVCPMRTLGCTNACLNTGGRGGMMAGVSRLTHAMVEAGIQNSIQKARIRKTKRFFTERDAFMADLASDVGKAVKRAVKQGFTPAFRLNGTSDIRWENYAVPGFKNIFEAFPDVQFYDYTKIPNRKNIPANYHLTFSLADGNDASARLALENGLNVAAVFRDKVKVAQYEAENFAVSGRMFPVFNGDKSDVRFRDPAGHVIALFAKGHAKKDMSGFVRD